MERIKIIRHPQMNIEYIIRKSKKGVTVDSRIYKYRVPRKLKKKRKKERMKWCMKVLDDFIKGNKTEFNKKFTDFFMYGETRYNYEKGN